MFYPIEPSRKLIRDLEKSGLKLTDKQKNIIHKNFYDAIISAYAEGKNTNGCDCGQPSCSYCN